VSSVALIAQAVSLLVDSSNVGVFWLLVVIFLQRGQDIPPIDDITPIGAGKSKGVVYYGRMFAFGICVLLAAATLVPMPLDLILGAAQIPATVGPLVGDSFQGISV
jgi:hypothetical protein